MLKITSMREYINPKLPKQLELELGSLYIART